MKIERFLSSDYSALKDVFARVYPANPLLQRKAYFDWQFLEHPYNTDGQYTLWLLKDGETIKGFYGWVPVEIIHQGLAHRGCEPLLWWVDESARFHGLELLRRIMSDFPVRLYHYCSEDSIRVFEKLGMPLFPLSRWIAVLNPAEMTRLFHIDKASSIRRAHDMLHDAIQKGAGGIRRPARFQNEMELGFGAWTTIRSHLSYTRKFLNWRYCEIPGHDYRIIASADGGWAVYRIERISAEAVSVVRIIEWRFPDRDAAEALAFIAGEAEAESAVLMDFFCSAPDVGHILEKCGFVSCEGEPWKSMPRLFRPISPAGPLISCIDAPPYRDKNAVDFSAWYISRGNGDIDRVKI